MTEHGPLARKYIDATAEMFTDNAKALELFAPDCVWDAMSGRVEGADAVAAMVDSVRAATGWNSHEVLHTAEAGPVLTVLARNTTTSGAEWMVGGVALFNEAGQISVMKSCGVLPQ